MSEKMRAEFHEWCDKNGFASDRYELCDLCEKYKHLCGEYVIPDSRIMWMAWQASRSAMVVELPRCWSDEGRDYRDDLIDRLDAAGVSYK